MGNTFANVSRIDKTAVVGSIFYSITGGTNQDVMATISFNKTGVVVTNNSGSMNVTFTGNDTFTFDFTDVYGNT